MLHFFLLGTLLCLLATPIQTSDSTTTWCRCEPEPFERRGLRGNDSVINLEDVITLPYEDRACVSRREAALRNGNDDSSTRSRKNDDEEEMEPSSRLGDVLSGQSSMGGDAASPKSNNHDDEAAPSPKANTDESSPPKTIPKDPFHPVVKGSSAESHPATLQDTLRAAEPKNSPAHKGRSKANKILQGRNDESKGEKAQKGKDGGESSPKGKSNESSPKGSSKEAEERSSVLNLNNFVAPTKVLGGRRRGIKGLGINRKRRQRRLQSKKEKEVVLKQKGSVTDELFPCP